MPTVARTEKNLSCFTQPIPMKPRSLNLRYLCRVYLKLECVLIAAEQTCSLRTLSLSKVLRQPYTFYVDFTSQTYVGVLRDSFEGFFASINNKVAEMERYTKLTRFCRQFVGAQIAAHLLAVRTHAPVAQHRA